MAILEHFRLKRWELDEFVPQDIEQLCRRIDQLAAEAAKAEREANRG